MASGSDYRKRTYDAEQVAHLSSLLLFDTQPPTDPERDESVLTCGNTRILKFTLIVERMPNRGGCAVGLLRTKGIVLASQLSNPRY